MAATSRRLTPADATPAERRELFCQAYVRLNGAAGRAAIAAGYPSPSASARASELMRREDVLQRINTLLAEKMAKEGIEALRIVKELSRSSSQKDAVRLRSAQMLIQLAGLTAKAQQELEAARRTREGLPKTRDEMVAELGRHLTKLQEITAGRGNFLIPETIGGPPIEPEPIPEPEEDHSDSLMWKSRHKGGGRRKKTAEVDLPEDALVEVIPTADEDWVGI